MPFRATFDCLWCGRPWQARDQGDLTGWAMLCADCVERAQDNGFLRFRVRAALRERSGGGATTSEATAGRGSGRPLGMAAVPGPLAVPGPSAVPGFERASSSSVVTAPGSVSTSAAAPSTGVGSDGSIGIGSDGSIGIGSDDWYLRRGRFARGPALDLAWHAELDEVTAWLDGQPLTGSIVELAAGSGWWSPLLAGKGELSVYDASPEALDRARERLVAHRLRAHLHVRDPWAEPDRPVDGVILATMLWRLDDDRADEALALAHRWLRPGGRLVVIEPRPDPMTWPVDRPVTTGPGSSVPDRDAGWLETAFGRAGLRPEVGRSTARFFLLGAAVRPD